MAEAGQRIARGALAQLEHRGGHAQAAGGLEGQQLEQPSEVGGAVRGRARERVRLPHLLGHRQCAAAR
jgi:hypothetical protein